MSKFAEKKKYLIAAAIGTGLFFLGSIIYSIIVLVISVIDGKGQNVETDPYAMSILQYLSYVPFLVGAIILLKDYFINDFRKMKKRPGKVFLTSLWCFGIMYGANIVVSIIYSLFGDQGESANESIINEILLSDAALPMIISVCILAPVAEEILFRKIMFGLCEKTFNFKPMITVIISTLVFSFIHVTDPESFKYIFQYIPLAFAICLCYHKSGNNIYASIFLHAINNTLAVVATYLSL